MGALVDPLTWGNVLLALHMIVAVVWVGGMFFALRVLRPSLGVLAPPERLALHAAVFARFFRVVWHVMPLMLASGYAMLFLIYGGFAGVHWPVHLMHLLGLIMAAVFLALVFGPWRAMQAAMAGGDAAGAAAALDRIRRLVTVNLVLGLLTVAVAALG